MTCIPYIYMTCKPCMKSISYMKSLPNMTCIPYMKYSRYMTCIPYMKYLPWSTYTIPNFKKSLRNTPNPTCNLNYNPYTCPPNSNPLHAPPLHAQPPHVFRTPIACMHNPHMYSALQSPACVTPTHALGAPILCMRNPRHAFCAAGTTPTCTWGSNPLHGNKIHPMLALLALYHSIAYPSHSYLLHALCTTTPRMHSTLQPPTCTPQANPVDALQNSSDLIRPHPTSPNLFRTHPTSSDLIRSHPISSDLIRPLPTSSDIIRPHPTSSELIRSHPTSSDLIRPLPNSSDIIRPHRRKVSEGRERKRDGWG